MIPCPFGFSMWSGVRRRLAKKIIDSYGRELFRRFTELDGFKLGDLVSTCDGLNSRVVEVEPDYVFTRRGKVLVDLHIRTDKNSCSLYHCGVRPPISYKEAVTYRDEIVKAWAGNDVWGFALRYADLIIHEDGTYTGGETWNATTRDE